MKRALLITLLVTTVLGLQAQKVWTLDECINYALEHNLDLQKSQLARQQAEYQYKMSQNAWLPTLNANAGEYLGFGQSPSYTGIYVSDNSSSSSFGANLSLPLFQGLNLYNTAKADALNLQATEMDRKAAQLNLKLNVIGFYMQVLYGKEQVEIARRQTELSTEQLEKTQQLFENGRIAEADVYESQAQLATDQSNLTQAETDLALSLLTLTQALEIEDSEDFEVSDPEAFFAGQNQELDAPQNTIAQALLNQPSMEAARLRLQKSHYDLKATKSAWYPSLDFYAGYSNGLYHYFSDNYPNAPVNEQLKRNSRAQLGVSLNIPIFNGMKTKYRVKMTELSIDEQQLNLENTEKSLRKEIRQAYGNAKAAKQKMEAMKNSLDASRVAYEYAKAGFEMGKKTLLELNESKTRLHKAESDLLQARYEYLYRIKIIELYRNVE
ncbi:MAG: TolC family protein [Bacteroidales bacterium]|nr:TolC family protein [Bacteroidales bacterium]